MSVLGRQAYLGLYSSWIDPDQFDFALVGNKLLEIKDGSIGKHRLELDTPSNTMRCWFEPDSQSNIAILIANSPDFENQRDSITPLNIEVMAGEGCTATLIQYHLNAIQSELIDSSIRLEPRSTLKHIVLEQGLEIGSSRFSSHIVQSENSAYEAFILPLAGLGTDFAIECKLDGDGARCRINAGLIPAVRQRKSLDVMIRHCATNTASHCFARTVALDHGKAIFRGKIINDPGSEHSSIHLENKCLLLSEHAEAITRPEFEIYNDQLRACTHGATMGHLNDEALFYLESRGLPRPFARKMLIDAFLEPLRVSLDLPFFADFLRYFSSMFETSMFEEYELHHLSRSTHHAS